MLVLSSPHNDLYNPRYEYYDGKRTSHAEKPERIAEILKACTELGLNLREVDEAVDRSLLAQVHNPHYIKYLRNKCSDIRNEEQIMPSAFIRDTYSPLTRHTYEAALKSANLAVVGAEELLSGNEKEVYALCRPPGHHAEVDGMSGYCYINNAALAAKKLSEDKKVAILDIDYHHGNGSQHIFYEDNSVLYASLHADPEQAFPYASGYEEEKGREKGVGYNFNFPLDLELTLKDYLDTLGKAIKCVNSYSPDYLILSLGFDTYENDPIGGLGITVTGFKEIASKIKAELDYPTLIVQEGGYNVKELKNLSKNFLEGYLS